MVKTHFGQHGDECFACKIQFINVSGAAMPTRKANLVSQLDYSAKREKDIDAYKRLRKEGNKVKSTTDARMLEREARTTFELESGMVAPTPSMSRRVEQAQSEAQEVMTALAKEDA